MESLTRKKTLLLFVALLNFALAFAQDGSGHDKTVQEAFNAVPLKKENTVFIKNGIYKEKRHSDASKGFAALIGADKFKTILTYDDHTGAAAPAKYDFVVAKDGSGNFTSVQEAINAVPDHRKNTTVIFIKNGTYKEKLVLPESKSNVTFIGESTDSTILTYDDYALKKNIFGEEKATAGSSSFYLYGHNFTAENITFANSSGPVGQALAVWVQGDKCRFINCRFLGFQDTIYTNKGRHYFKNCYIEGTVDFIFGSSTAVFDSCTIFCKSGGYITAASTPEDQKYGYVFLHCTITGSAPAHSFYLGRPWRPYAKVAFIECKLGDLIKPEGWDNWRNPENEKTAYFAEYKNTGAGYTPKKRVSWSHQLTDDEAKQYTIEKIFNNWDPALNQ